jgi:hypothetical protein
MRWAGGRSESLPTWNTRFISGGAFCAKSNQIPRPANTLGGLLFPEQATHRLRHLQPDQSLKAASLSPGVAVAYRVNGDGGCLATAGWLSGKHMQIECNQKWETVVWPENSGWFVKKMKISFEFHCRPLVFTCWEARATYFQARAGPYGTRS